MPTFEAAAWDSSLVQTDKSNERLVKRKMHAYWDAYAPGLGLCLVIEILEYTTLSEPTEMTCGSASLKRGIE
jgi:hypothetical protein